MTDAEALAQSEAERLRTAISTAMTNNVRRVARVGYGTSDGKSIFEVNQITGAEPLSDEKFVATLGKLSAGLYEKDYLSRSDDLLEVCWRQTEIKMLE